MNGGILDLILRTIKTENLIEQDFEISLRERMAIDLKDRKRYLLELSSSCDSFYDKLQSSIKKELIRLNSTYDRNQEFFTPAELSEILGCSKPNIHKWIENKQIANYIQKVKGGKIEIPKSEIDELCFKLPKYQRNWDRHCNK